MSSRVGGGWGDHLTGWTAEQHSVSLKEWCMAEPAVCALLASRAKINSVVDFGCGGGRWLAEFEKLGVTELVGVEPDPSMPEVWCIYGPKISSMHTLDATEPINFGRKFDLVICLEVIEHILPEGTDTLLDNLTRHGDCILFSGAQPETVDEPSEREGKMIQQHINTHTEAEYIQMFAKRGYHYYPALTRKMRSISREPWYQMNISYYAITPEVCYNVFRDGK